MPRIAIVSMYFVPEVGAAQERLRAIAESLAVAGNQVEVVTAIPNYPLGRFLKPYKAVPYQREAVGGIQVHRVWVYPSNGRAAGRLFGYLTFAVMAAIGLMRIRRPDLIFVESPPPFVFATAWVIGRARGSRVVVNVADLWPDTLVSLGILSPGPAVRLMRLFERWMYARADLITVVTDGIRSELTRRGIPQRKVVALLNGVDAKMFRPTDDDTALRKRLDIGGRKVLLFAGTLGYAAGADQILDAALLIRDRTILVLFVGGGSEVDRLRDRCADLGLSNVRFLGPVPAYEITAYYSIAFAALSTLRDADAAEYIRPAKVLAALACAKPVIYAGSGEGADLVNAAAGGIVVPPDDPPALAAAIDRLASAPELAQRLGANGRRYAEQHLRWEDIVANWLAEVRAQGLLTSKTQVPLTKDTRGP